MKASELRIASSEDATFFQQRTQPAPKSAQFRIEVLGNFRLAGKQCETSAARPFGFVPSKACSSVDARCRHWGRLGALARESVCFARRRRPASKTSSHFRRGGLPSFQVWREGHLFRTHDRVELFSLPSSPQFGGGPEPGRLACPHPRSRRGYPTVGCARPTPRFKICLRWAHCPGRCNDLATPPLLLQPMTHLNIPFHHS